MAIKSFEVKKFRRPLENKNVIKFRLLNRQKSEIKNFLTEWRKSLDDLSSEPQKILVVKKNEMATESVLLKGSSCEARYLGILERNLCSMAT